MRNNPVLPAALLDVPAVAEILNRPASWVYQQVEAGQLPVIRVGRFLRFDPVEIAAWLDARREGPRPQRLAENDRP